MSIVCFTHKNMIFNLNQTALLNLWRVSEIIHLLIDCILEFVFIPALFW